MVANLDHKGIEFPISKKSYHKIEFKNNIGIHVFRYKNKCVYPFYLSKENFENYC